MSCMQILLKSLNEVVLLSPHQYISNDFVLKKLILRCPVSQKGKNMTSRDLKTFVWYNILPPLYFARIHPVLHQVYFLQICSKYNTPSHQEHGAKIKINKSISPTLVTIRYEIYLAQRNQPVFGSLISGKT